MSHYAQVVENSGKITDERIANSCVRVSARGSGGLSNHHLDISTNPKTFADELSTLHTDGASVILTGGSSTNESIHLLSGVHQELTNKGFIVAPIDDSACNDTGGDVGRTATLTCEGVEVYRNDHTAGIVSVRKLSFPR